MMHEGSDLYNKCAHVTLQFMKGLTTSLTLNFSLYLLPLQVN